MLVGALTGKDRVLVGAWTGKDRVLEGAWTGKDRVLVGAWTGKAMIDACGAMVVPCKCLRTYVQSPSSSEYTLVS